MAPNLAWWTNVPIAEHLGEAIGLPTFLERDTNVAVMAEWRFGAARGTRNAIYITVSTGRTICLSDIRVGIQASPAASRSLPVVTARKPGGDSVASSNLEGRDP